MNDHKCGAKTRNGNPCKRAPASGSTRCKLHGGYSLKGTESGTYKHGLYSKYAGDQLKDVLVELQHISSDELIQPEHEIRLMQALILKCKALQNEFDDLRDLDMISRIIERLITAKQRSQAIMIEQQRLIPATDIERFLEWMENMIVERIGEQGYEIMDTVKTFKLDHHEN